MQGTKRPRRIAVVVALAISVFGFVLASGAPAQAQTNPCNIADFIVDGELNTTGYLTCVAAQGAPQPNEAQCATGEVRNIAVADPYRVAAGQNVTFTGYGFAPSSEVELFVSSGNPALISLGKFAADAQGNVAVTVTIPLGTSVGAQAVSALGTLAGSNPTSLVACAAVEVLADAVAAPTAAATGALPVTGSDSGRLVAYGVALLLLGGAAIYGSLRQRRTNQI